MAIQGFNKSFYLNAKLAQLQSNSETAADWAGKDAAFLEARFAAVGLTAEQHYEQYGYQEGLAPNAFFNPAEYIRAKATAMFNDANNSYLTIDAAAQDFVNLWGGNVYNHYLQYGEAEGVNPSNSFDVSSYYDAKLAQLQAAGNTEITTTAQVKAAFDAAGLTALEHFIAFGQNEGISAPTVPAGEQVNVDTSVPGETFTLTTGADNFTGTANDDTFNAAIDDNTAANNTLTVLDQINGGAGTDTLNVIVDASGAGVALPTATISGVENMFFRNVSGQTLTVDANIPTGEQQLWSDRSTNQVDFTNVSAGTTIGVKGDGNVTNGLTTAAHAAAVTNASVAITGGTTAGNITLTGAGLTAATIATSGAAKNTVGTIDVAASKTVTVDGAANLTATGITTTATDGTLNVKGAGAFALGTLDTGIDTVDASGNTGGVTLTLDAEADTKFTGGSGADKVTTGNALTTGSVNAGAGNDTLVVADSTHLNSATLGGKYTNFETLGVLNGVSVDLDHIAGITAVEMTDGNAATELKDLSAAQAAAVTIRAGDGAATIGVKGATTVGQVDTVKMTFNDGDTTLNENINASTSTFTLAGVENLEITAIDKVDVTQSATASGALSSVKLSGAGDINFVTGNMATSNFALDASGATGKTTLDASGFATNGVAITGGSGVDTITGSAQADIINAGSGNDIINGGAGNDTINAGAGNDVITVNTANSADTISVGAGSDTVKFSAATPGAMFATSAGTTGVVKITDFAAGTDKIGLVDTASAFTSMVLSSAQTITSAADLTGVYAGISAIGASTDDGALSGAVVTVSAGAAAGTYLYVNDVAGAGVSSTDDMLINLTGLTGTLSANDFVFA